MILSLSSLRRAPLSLALLIVACGGMSDDEGAAPTNATQSAAPEANATVPAPPPAAPAEARWEAGSGGEGASLSLGAGAGRRLTLSCPSDGGMLVVNVPAFRAIGSEERMSVGSDGTVFALVADPAGDKKRGGVTGRGAFPSADLAAILAGPEGIGVNYGAQNSGPHAPPPPGLARAFLAACRG